MSSSMALNTPVPVARSHAAGRHYRRFGPVEIVMHAFMMIAFIGLAFTGVPLLFADHAWAAGLVQAGRRLPRAPR